MKRFFYCMSGMMRTWAAFLLILSCLVSATAASVRAEEQMENGIVMDSDETPAGPEEETKEQTEGEAEEEIKETIKEADKETAKETVKDEEKPEEEAAAGSKEDPAGSPDLPGGEKTDSKQTEEDQTDEENTKVSSMGKVPAGRQTGRACGTAYVAGEGGIMFRSAPNTRCVITPGTEHRYGNRKTKEFLVETDKGSYVGYCAQPSQPIPSGEYTVSELTNDDVKLALMFGTDGPWRDEVSGMCGDAADPFAYIHALIGLIYNDDAVGLTEAQVQGLREELSRQSGRKNRIKFLEYRAYVAYTAGQDIVWLEYEGPVSGNVTLCKKSSDPGMTDGNPCYSLGGAVYGIYTDASCTAESGRLTTDEAGESGPVELLAGDYWIKEITAPIGYRKDTQVYQVHVDVGAKQRLEVSDPPEYDPAGLELVKRDQENGNTSRKKSASLAGAQFTVRYYKGYYDRESLPDHPARTWVLETKGVPDPSGASVKYQALLQETYKVSGDPFYMAEGTPVLPLGTLVIEETKAPAGYMLEGAYLQAEGSTEKVAGQYITQVSREDGRTVLKGGNQYAVYDQEIRGGVKVRKRDFDTNGSRPQGGASFENAVFAVISLNESPVIVDGKAYAMNEIITTIKTDETGIAQTPERFLPCGKYQVIETGAPAGYLRQGVWRREFFIIEDGRTVDLTNAKESILNRVMRGDFELRKIDANTRKAMPDVRFSLTSVTTGESHQITTDENGYYSSSSDWNMHTQNTNQGGAKDGLWFGLDDSGGSTAPDDGLGALPYDTYILEEIPSEANKGKEMLKIPFVINKDQMKLDLGDLENQDIDQSEPSISTSARNEASGDRYAKAGIVTVIDSVLYEGLKEQQEYVLKCTPIDKETEKPLTDEKGDPITGEHTFTPAVSAGITEVECTFDGAELEGKEIVLYEELYEKDKMVAWHKDLHDEEQTIRFPKVRTSAKDVRTDSRNAQAAEDTVIVDTVFYSNLTPGQEYMVEGILMDQETEEPLLEKGEPITAETAFTPESDSGSADVTFAFDASGLPGKTAVAFESITKEGKEIAAHRDIHYEGQTIYFPEIGTSAAEKTSGSRQITAESEITVLDSVTYKNLIPGEEYMIKGILMDKSTGEPLIIEEKQITAETTWIPEAKNGTAEAEFTFHAGALKNAEIVVFEKLFLGGHEIAAHEDLNDSAQTVRINMGETPPENKEEPSAPEKAVKTGDAADLTPALLLFLLSLLVLIAYARKKLG